MIVIDASAFLELLLRSDVGIAVERLMATDDASTPELFDAEVFHRIVSFGKTGVFTSHEVESAVLDLRDAPITRFDHRPLLEGALEMSAALSGYDSLYAALARELHATLVTGDEKLAATAHDQLSLQVANLSAT